ncbi:hypothetical protein NDU88_004982 [Pleurodeles waltl]|uniref:Uncharacterized protein n=1 Tax=Pleurodeles waltl TaxID=8319 RepID=A0AAV7NLD6_PLEWA|nr:hypothetical protein NDU88_004982 [Pleurodeles waltl]
MEDPSRGGEKPSNPEVGDRDDVYVNEHTSEQECQGEVQLVARQPCRASATAAPSWKVMQGWALKPHETCSSRPLRWCTGF